MEGRGSLKPGSEQSRELRSEKRHGDIDINGKSGPLTSCPVFFVTKTGEESAAAQEEEEDQGALLTSWLGFYSRLLVRFCLPTHVLFIGPYNKAFLHLPLPPAFWCATHWWNHVITVAGEIHFQTFEVLSSQG